MTSPVIFVGGEDISFTVLNGSWTTSGITNFGAYPDTTSGRFRSGYGRYGMNVAGNTPNTTFIRGAFEYAASTFWASAYFSNYFQYGTGSVSSHLIRFADSSGVVRLRLRNTNTAQSNPAAGPYVLEKISAAGTVTQLGSSSSSGLNNNPSSPDKIDIYVNYGTSGTINVYFNKSIVISYSGDVTTDGATSLAAIDLGQTGYPASNQNPYAPGNWWSEVLVQTENTLPLIGVLTQVPTTSAMAQNLANTTSPDTFTTSGASAAFTMTPALPSGNFSILSVVQHAQVITNGSGPAHVELGCIIDTTNSYNSGSLAASTNWGLVAWNWDLNPYTGVAWVAGDLINNGTIYEMSVTAVT